MAAKSASRRTKAQRDKARRDRTWQRPFQTYVARTIREHLDRAKAIAEGAELQDDDKLQIALSGAPIEWLAGIYGVTRSTVQRLQRRPAYFNSSDKAWRGKDHELGPGLRSINSAADILRRGTK